MKLTGIFAKPVDRPIEGVIKADDDASLRLEIDEYVITNEVEKRLEGFLDAYTHYENANGVWISGFFGSGKSHLLKMLALVLENRDIQGTRAADVFLAKCQGNAILHADLARAVAIPSRSILFNIDQKADVIHKSQTDALLAVFVKVFDETCGYYGKQPHIAQFERDLDSRGQYQAFKEAYERLSGKSWLVGREQALLESRSISAAYAEVSGDSPTDAQGILERYRSTYRLSIEDFANQVKEYVNRQGPRFRLNFFVDEAGQYIADNTKLMTNLQTVAESLATRCQGRAWVLVTAQEDMNTVVGEMGKQQSNDFTKIQARFKNRMKLTSADVAEVIQKRLLTKTDAGITILGNLYHAQVNNFKTLFDFADGAQTYRNFQDRDHFIHSYPFIPYQFALFQAAIHNLSQHNAFEGRHSSVGERSMLGVFQQVAIHLGDREVGQLATFDLMFEGIRTALKSAIQRAIIQAEQHLGDPFAIRVLKALFLVKYVKEFKATIRNLRVLMQDAFDQDTPQLEKAIESALGLLEQQTYIQRNGEVYEFLTDEEKDVEQEIKATEVDQGDVLDEVEKLVFDGILKSRKLRHEASGQDFAFARKVDDRLRSRDLELSIHVITPFHEFSDQIDTLKMQSASRDELLVVLPTDERFARDLLLYKRTEKYIRQNVTTAQQDSTRRILTEKSTRNHERSLDLHARLATLLGQARLIVQGAEIDLGSADPVARIGKGFQDLVARIYPNLPMLPSTPYTDLAIGKILRESGESLFGNDAIDLTESEQEVLGVIQGNRRQGVRTTVKGVVEKFERKPYGWPLIAIVCTVAKLCARGKIEARADGAMPDAVALEKQLLSTAAHANVVLEPQEQFSPQQVRQLKDLFSDMFNSPPRASEPRALVAEFQARLADLLASLRTYSSEVASYPFLVALKPAAEAYRAHEGKPTTWFLVELVRQADTWLDLKEQVVDPISKFMEGSQRTIYDEARAWHAANVANFPFVLAETATDLKAVLDDPGCYRGNKVQDLKSRLDAAREQLDRAISNEIAAARARLSGLENRLTNTVEFAGLTSDQQQQLRQDFPRANGQLDGMTLIATARQLAHDFEDRVYPTLVSRMAKWIERPVPPLHPSGDDDPVEPEPGPEVAFVLSKQIEVTFEKAWLTEPADVDRYVERLRKAMLAELDRGKRIQL